MQLGRYEFMDPWPLSIWQPPSLPGIYAILVRTPVDPPDQYRVIYVGQTANLAERGFPASHEKYRDWVHEAGHRLNIYVSWMVAAPHSRLRQLVEEELIKQYQPTCNDTGLGW